MQCKDIPDRVFLDAVLETAPMRGWSNRPESWRCRHDVAVTLARKLGLDEVPWRLVLAKAAKLIDRGLMDGCACGCRGDFCIPPK